MRSCWAVKTPKSRKFRSRLLSDLRKQCSLSYCQPLTMTKRSPFKYFKSSPEIIRLTVMLYVRFGAFVENVMSAMAVSD